jgi:hypothetical protein
MSVVGIWDVSIKSPFGEQVVRLEFSDESTGFARYGTESIGLQGVATVGDHTTWTVSLTQPMAIKLSCSVTVDGDAMSGTASAGFFGKFPLAGNRVSA